MNTRGSALPLDSDRPHWWQGRHVESEARFSGGEHWLKQGGLQPDLSQEFACFATLASSIS